MITWQESLCLEGRSLRALRLRVFLLRGQRSPCFKGVVSVLRGDGHLLAAD